MHITACNSKKKKKEEEKWKKLIVFLDGREGVVVDNFRRTGDFFILT